MKQPYLTIDRAQNGFIVREHREPGVWGGEYVFNSPSATAVGIGNLLEHGTVDRPVMPAYPPNMGATLGGVDLVATLLEQERQMLKECIAAKFGIQNEFKARSTTAAEVRDEQRRQEFHTARNFVNVDPQEWITIQRHGPNTTECPNPGVYRVARGRTGGRPGSERHYLKVERDGSLHYGTRAPGHFKVEYQNCPAWDSWPQFLQSSLWTQFRLVRVPTVAKDSDWTDIDGTHPDVIGAGEFQIRNQDISEVIRVKENGQIEFACWVDRDKQTLTWTGKTWRNWRDLRNSSSWKQVAALPPL